MSTPPCSHLDQVLDVQPRTPAGCEECLKNGTRWVHLRLCLSCGHVGCCDDSPEKHATKHFHQSAHAVIRSFSRPASVRTRIASLARSDGLGKCGNKRSEWLRALNDKAIINDVRRNGLHTPTRRRQCIIQLLHTVS